MNTYDYIIIGAGAAGLMLADAMGRDHFFSQKSILLLDSDKKKSNDRTWCFWEKGKGRFDGILSSSWKEIIFSAAGYHRSTEITPYKYKMIKGIDFYNFSFKCINKYANIHFAIEKVTGVEESKEFVTVTTASKKEYRSLQIFSSMLGHINGTGTDKLPWLQQHFIGWFVKTRTSQFNENAATFMDFSVPQKGNTRFMYVLPLSTNEALIEYTLFSESLLPKIEYEEAIVSYLTDRLGIEDFEITDREEGNIPMTCYNFTQHNTARIFHIGAAGGWTKPSTGYTFKNTAKKTAALVKHLKNKKSLLSFTQKRRFWYYDLLFLDILAKHNEKGHMIFEQLFKKRDPRLILKFLDEETTILEDLMVIAACPKRIFMMALVRRLLGIR